MVAQKIFGNKNTKYCTAWNFGPGRKTHLRVIDFAKLFRLKMKSNSKLIINKNPDLREKKNLDLDSKKSKTNLNWKPVMTIDQTLAFTADWYLAHKNKKNMYQFTIDQIIKFMKFILFLKIVIKKNLIEYPKLVSNPLVVFF